MSDLGRSPASYRGLVAHWRQHATSTPNRDLQNPLRPATAPHLPRLRHAGTLTVTDHKFAPEPITLASDSYERMGLIVQSAHPVR